MLRQLPGAAENAHPLLHNITIYVRRDQVELVARKGKEAAASIPAANPCADVEVQRRLWAVSEELIGVEYPV